MATPAASAGVYAAPSMALSKASVDKALARVRDLIERLRATASDAPAPGTTGFEPGTVVFARASLGGLQLAPTEGRMLRECEHALTELHAGARDLRLLSREAVSDLLRETMLRALRPARETAATESRAVFERRMRRELNALRKAIIATPQQWTVTVPVDQLVSESLPAVFGGVTFDACTEGTANAVARGLSDFEPRRKVKLERAQAQQRIHERARARIAKGFLGHDAIASVVVGAVDTGAAERIGLHRIRRAVDIINFFEPRFRERSLDKGRAYVLPDAPRRRPPVVVRAVEGEAFHSRAPWPEDDPVTMIAPDSPRGVEIGLARASSLVTLERPTDLDDRIVSALAWAGRANVEHRPEQAFLLLAIALEALLTNPQSRTGVSERLRLRTAHLIGTRPAQRKRIAEDVRNLYATRSAIVHGGDWRALTESDLKKLEHLVRYALTAVLTHPPYMAMRSVAELERWLDDRVFEGDPQVP